MSTIGAINVKIGADSTGLEAGMKRANSSVQKNNSQLRANLNLWAKWGSTAALAAAGVAAAIIKSQLSQIDALAKTSDRLNIAVEDLQALRFAAEQTGASAATLDGALQKMTRNLGDAKNGTGEAKDALERLGLTAQDLINIAPDQAFTQIAQAMQGLDTQAEKVDAAFRLFGRSGAELVNLLDTGADGINAFKQEAQDLGLTLTRIDATKIEAANDAMNRVRKQLQAIAQTATVEVAPIITAVSELLVQMGKDGGNAGDTIRDSLDSLITAIGFVADAVHGVRLIFAGLEMLVADLGVDVIKEFQRIAQFMQDFTNSAINMINTVYEGLSALPGVDPIEPIPQVTLDSVVMFNNLTKSAEVTANNARKAFNEMANQPLPSTQFRKFVDEARKAADEAAAEIAKTRDALGGFMRAGSVGDDEFLQTVREQLMTEEQLQIASHQKQLTELGDLRQKRLDVITDYQKQEQALLERQRAGEDVTSSLDALRDDLDAQIAALTEYHTLEQQLEAQHQAAIAEIRKGLLPDHEAALAALQDRLMSEEELELAKYQRDKALIEQAVTDKAEQHAMLEQLQAEHNERMAEIQATTVPEGMQYTPEENEKFLEGLAQRFASEEELEIARYKSQLERLEEANAQELEIKGGFNAAKEALDKEHAERSAAIAEQEAQAKRNIMKGMMSNLSTLMNTGSKKMFQIGKTAAIANALITGYESVVLAYRGGLKASGGNPAVGAAFAATAAAATAAQIGQIRKQSFGGGGSPTAFSGGLPATNTTTNGGMGPVNPNANGGQRTISINLVGGGMFSAEQIRELIGKINEQTGDGVNLAVGG